MARFHRKMRARVDSLLANDAPISGVIVLSTVTGLGPSPGSSAAPVSYNAAENYVREAGLDPSRWRERQIGGFGLVVALGTNAVHFVRSTGNMRSGDIEPSFSADRSQTALRYGDGASIPGARTQLLHFDLPDGDYVVGSAPLGRIATNEMNDVEDFLRSWGDSAIDLS